MISKVHETSIESRAQESSKKEKDRGSNRGSESVAWSGNKKCNPDRSPGV